MATGVLPDGSPIAESPHITAHAADRWDERTAADAVSPETAWHDATRLPDLASDQHDELRVHEPQAVVLARRDAAIVTILATTGPDAQQWLQSHVYRTVGNIWDSPVATLDGGDRDE